MDSLFTWLTCLVFPFAPEEPAQFFGQGAAAGSLFQLFSRLAAAVVGGLLQPVLGLLLAVRLGRLVPVPQPQPEHGLLVAVLRRPGVELGGLLPVHRHWV